MAFVPNYEHDIFVSYAHVDDARLPGMDHGWVTTFVDFLRIRMNQTLRREDAYSLWMDPELAAHARISDQLLEAIGNTAVLLVVLSPGYIGSEWCKRERNGFLRLVRTGGAARVIVVEREPVEESEWPDELKDLKPFRFWLGKPPRILWSPKPGDEYYLRMDDLCRDLADLLKRLRRDTAGRPDQIAAFSAAAAGAAGTGPLVYLARASYDLDHEWNDVKRYLDQAGVRVLPETSYLPDAVTFQACAERDIRRCSLVVQLLSVVPFRKPATSPSDFAEIQLDLARQLGKPVLQWRHPELDTELVVDARHKKLLEGSEVRAEAIEDFKQEVRKRAFAKPPVPPARPLEAFVFVNADMLDRPLADQVCDSLQRLGAGYVLPQSLSAQGKELDPKAVRKDLENKLRVCDALIIVYGNSDVDWVRRQLLFSQKALLSRKRPLNALAVFEGPPADKQPLDMRLPGMRMVDCRKGFSQDELGQFLAMVRAEDGK